MSARHAHAPVSLARPSVSRRAWPAMPLVSADASRACGRGGVWGGRCVGAGRLVMRGLGDLHSGPQTQHQLGRCTTSQEGLRRPHAALLARQIFKKGHPAPPRSPPAPAEGRGGQRESSEARARISQQQGLPAPRRARPTYHIAHVLAGAPKVAPRPLGVSRAAVSAHGGAQCERRGGGRQHAARGGACEGGERAGGDEGHGCGCFCTSLRAGLFGGYLVLCTGVVSCQQRAWKWFNGRLERT